MTLGASPPGAFLGALVFGVHPVHTEAVDVAFNRSEILACLAVTGGLAWFFRHAENRPAGAFAGASLLYLFGLLCRESAVTLPVLLLLGPLAHEAFGAAGRPLSRAHHRPRPDPTKPSVDRACPRHPAPPRRAGGGRPQ